MLRQQILLLRAEALERLFKVDKRTRVTVDLYHLDRKGLRVAASELGLLVLLLHLLGRGRVLALHRPQKGNGLVDDRKVHMAVETRIYGVHHWYDALRGHRPFLHDSSSLEASEELMRLQDAQ